MPRRHGNVRRLNLRTNNALGERNSGGDADRSAASGEKDPVSIWSLSQDATDTTHYLMVGSKVTLAFMELEIRQFVSAFSISSLALAASAFAESVIVGFNVMVVN